MKLMMLTIKNVKGVTSIIHFDINVATICKINWMWQFTCYNNDIAELPMHQYKQMQLSATYI
jgi:hypothetical protein